MFVLGNFIVAVARIIDIALTIYMWIIIIRAVLSWVNPDPYNPIVRMLYQVTEPVMALVRRWIPFRGMGIDLSPSRSSGRRCRRLQRAHGLKTTGLICLARPEKSVNLKANRDPFSLEQPCREHLGD